MKMSGEGEENDRRRRMRDKETEAGGQEGDGKVTFVEHNIHKLYTRILNCMSPIRMKVK